MRVGGEWRLSCGGVGGCGGHVLGGSGLLEGHDWAGLGLGQTPVGLAAGICACPILGLGLAVLNLVATR